MISITVPVSGGTVGRELAGDPEEMTYALEEMAGVDHDDLREALQDRVFTDKERKVIQAFAEVIIAGVNRES